jgi:hypothetical protein
MKLLAVIAIGLISIGANAQENFNWAGFIDGNSTSCSVEPITISCLNGGEVTAPGCSISCKENLSAKCEQGETYTASCRALPAKCKCF